MKRKRLPLLTLLTWLPWLAAGLLAGHGLAEAAPIAVTNPGFEDPATATVTNGAPPGWTLNPPEFGGGVWNINDSPFGFWNVPAPEGKQVGWISQAADPNGPTDFTQALGDSLQSNTFYNLSGFVGHPIGFGAGNGTVFTVELLAGSNVLAFSTGTAVPDGQFDPFSVVFDSTGSPFVGQTLGIRLATNHAQTAYDQIALDATLIPEPSSRLLLAAGGALLLAGLRRPIRASR